MKRASFTVFLTSNDEKNLENLQTICDRIGVKIQLEESPELSKIAKLDLGYLLFSWEEDEVNTKLSRKAGRKSKFWNKEYKPEMIRAKIKEQGANATAKELGISRQYMYKRLKEAESENRYRF